MNDHPAHVLSCPIPHTPASSILLAHGGGGRLSHQLLEQVFFPAFANPALDLRHDSAVLPLPGSRLAFTTDSHVVSPLFFPGGDIGTLAVYGTVNDLAMAGARPLYLSTGFILEEGFPMADLRRIVASMRQAADAAGVQLVTGDTKVVDRGKGDGVFINTSGIGVLEHDLEIHPARVCPGDAILVSGDLGRHGMAILSAREGLAFESTVESDCAPLYGVVASLLEAGLAIHCLRDLTRGGLAGALVEIATTAAVQLRIDEEALPVREEVRGACEILGLEPIHMANEGRFVCVLPAAQAGQALEVFQGHPQGHGARCIGEVRAGEAGLVTLRSPIGMDRVLDLPSGEQLPRIC